jgi:cytochrome c-type biogenesis protein CcmE
MNKKFIALVVVVAFVALALMYQASQAGTSHVYLPSELSRKGGQTLLRIRVAGRVAEGRDIDYTTEPRAELRFSIVDPPEKETATYRKAMEPLVEAADSTVVRLDSASPAPIPVLYRGLRPDMFSVGRDVIIDGEFSGGVLVASSLLTQCPSKYEAPSPEEQYGVGSPPSNSTSSSSY